MLLSAQTARAAAWRRIQTMRVWLTVAWELLNLGSQGSTRFHPCWPKMRENFLLLLRTEDNQCKVNWSGIQQRAGWSKGWNKCNQRRWEIRGIRKKRKGGKNRTMHKGRAAVGIKERKWEFGKWKKEQGCRKIPVSSCPERKGREADTINKRCQPCKIASQSSWERWAHFHAEHPQPWEQRKGERGESEGASES